MKILFLADPNSIHTQRWAKSLSQKGLEIYIFGLSQAKENLYTDSPQIKIYSGDINPSISKQNMGIFAKLSYVKVLSKLKKIIKEVKPDIIHAHYATSYGLLGALSGFHPLIISVWGSDVFDFPNRSWLHRSLLKFNLNKADKILSTSLIMDKETAKYTDKSIEVTPFGIDLNIFKKGASVDDLFQDTNIVIGTIKSLEKVYGIEYLLQAFEILKKKYPQLPLKLLIVGSGSQEKSLKNLAKILDIEKDTVFTGFVPYEKLPQYHNTISVFAALSNQESFGVAILEAAACEKPSVVSNVGGLPEIVDNNITGIVVPPADPQKAAEAIEKLILNKELYDKMGAAARKKVEKSYNWDDNVEQMIKIYKDLIK